MLRSQRLALALAAAALSGPVFATTTVYTSEASFLAGLALLRSSYTESFTGVPSSPPSSYSNGELSFGLGASGGLYGDPTGFVGTNLPDDELTVALNDAQAVGGYFFATDINPDFQSVNITLTLSDGTVESFTAASIGDSYRGFITDAKLTSLTMSAPGQSLYASVDDITVGIPEPTTWGLAGLAMAGLLVSRRRRVS